MPYNSRPSTSAELECTHWSARQPRRLDGAAAGPPVSASAAYTARRASTAWISRARGARCSGQCRYVCIVVSTAPVQVLKCVQPAGPARLPYGPARPPFVRAFTCHAPGHRWRAGHSGTALALCLQPCLRRWPTPAAPRGAPRRRPSVVSDSSCGP
jgi:hypothetical protein